MTDEQTTQGLRFAYSRLTETWYRVTEWEDKGDGKIVAHSKEEVDASEVPETLLERVDGEVRI